MYSLRKAIFGISLIATFICGGALNSYGQTQEDKDLAKQLIEIAEEIMRSTKAEDQARENYVQAATLDPSNIQANYFAGQYHLITVNKEQAAKYFEQVKKLDPNYRFDIDFKIGQSYQYGMNFEKALTSYESYRERRVRDDGYRGQDMVSLKEVDKKITECKNAIDFRANPADVKIVNLGNTINTEFEDFAPVINENEDFLIFTSKRMDNNSNQDVDVDNKPFEEIYFTRKNKNNSWGYASNLGKSINTKFHDSNLALSPDGNTLFLYKTDNNGDIFVSTRVQDTVWTEPKPLSKNINSDSFNESSVSISPDGNLLFFSSNRVGGLGQIDIYFSTKNEAGEWQRARNVGEVINTEFNEDGPFIGNDGKTLYFSSEGHKGMGGYDIYKSVYDSANQVWGAPENLGYPINTPDDDIYFVATKDGKRGYYASVREDGYGFTDIYMVTLPQKKDKEPEPIVEKTPPPVKTDSVPPVSPQPVTVTVSVTDATTGAAIDAKVSLKSSSGGATPGMTKPANGQFVFTLNNESASGYQLSVEASGYVFETRDINVPAMSGTAQNITRSIAMKKPVVNTTKVLRNIYFEFGKATLTQASYEELNKLYNMMSSNPNMTIELRGHTDNIGGKSYNKQLSQSRANAVKNFLLKKGIDARRVESNGYGEEMPLASNDDEKEGREYNRRVEFKILK